MKTSRRARIMLPLVSLVTAFALSAQAEPNGPPPKGGAKPAVQAARPGPHPGPGPGAMHQGGVPGRGPQNAHMARGNFHTRNFGGHSYHGRLAWEGGRWHHEIHNGRDGWWWDVGGAWYFYPQPMEGPPTYVSDVEVMRRCRSTDRRSLTGIRRRPEPMRQMRPTRRRHHLRHRTLPQAQLEAPSSAGYWEVCSRDGRAA